MNPGHNGLAGQVDFLSAARCQGQDFVIASDSEEPSPGYGGSFSLRLTRVHRVDIGMVNNNAGRDLARIQQAHPRQHMQELTAGKSASSVFHGNSPGTMAGL